MHLEGHGEDSQRDLLLWRVITNIIDKYVLIIDSHVHHQETEDEKKCHFTWNRLLVVLSMFSPSFLLLGLMLVDAFLLYVGYSHENSQCNRNLPLWLIVQGFAGVAVVVFCFLTNVNRIPGTGCFGALFSLFRTFTFIWLIVGSVWVFHISMIFYILILYSIRNLNMTSSK